MATMNQARDLMQGALVTWRDNNIAGVPIAHDNKRFSPKDDQNAAGEYMRSTIEHQTGTRPALGTNATRRSGIWFIQVFTAINTDMRRADVIGQSLLDFLRTWPVNEVRILEPAITEVGATDGAWFQVNVSATFEYDDFG